ncbi:MULTISPECIES: heme exporter protein CcmD [unclassified Idiomarina]|uniref:heme exporter protein CcmD n=1 Tax=unclassified Idiomarina TaxID=2614829 RepID=UPI00257F3BD3|nr:MULTISPECIES: heme exporter protein CcmD [unclassified Idiomarina]|tara:strand:+ start:4121 stop:4351 length:231 start_codon:yes stop_codon:yes gene_type:complete
MVFDSFTDFVAMGGYGLYVWLSFFLSFVVLAGVALETLLAKRQLVKKSRQLQQRQQRLARRTASRAAVGDGNEPKT